MNPDDLSYWIVAGRICGDDEDSYWCSPNRCTRAQAIDSFKHLMRELEQRESVNPEEESAIFVNIVARSDVPLPLPLRLLGQRLWRCA